MRLGVGFIGADPKGLTRERLDQDARTVESAGFDSRWLFDALRAQVD